MMKSLDRAIQVNVPFFFLSLHIYIIVIFLYA